MRCKFGCVSLNPTDMAVRVTILGVNCTRQRFHGLQVKLIQFAYVILGLLVFFNVEAVQLVKNNCNWYRKDKLQEEAGPSIKHRNDASCSCRPQKIQEV